MDVSHNTGATTISNSSLDVLDSPEGPSRSATTDLDVPADDRVVVVNRHEDSGVRMSEVEVVDLPPLYSPAER